MMEFALIIYGLVANGRLSGAANKMMQQTIYSGSNGKSGGMGSRSLAEAICVGVIWNNTEAISVVNWLEKFDMDEYIRVKKMNGG